MGQSSKKMIKRYSEWEKAYELKNRNDMSQKDFIFSQVSMAAAKGTDTQEKLDIAIGILKDAISWKDSNRLDAMYKALETVDEKGWKKSLRPAKRRCWKKYDHDTDGKYELFMTYYKVLQNLYVIEKRQEKQRDPKYKPGKQGICATIQYNYFRWLDVGTPSISGYNEWKEIVKYGTLFLTFVSNGFKIVLAQMGGRASFIGTALQAVAHLSFALYFYFLTQDDKALAIPKIVGFVISIITCYFIANAGNGYL